MKRHNLLYFLAFCVHFSWACRPQPCHSGEEGARGRPGQVRKQGGGQEEFPWLFTTSLGKCLQETLLNEASTGSSEIPILELAVPLMWASVRAGPASLCSGPLTPLRGSLGQEYKLIPGLLSLTEPTHLVSWKYTSWAWSVKVQLFPNCSR